MKGVCKDVCCWLGYYLPRGENRNCESDGNKRKRYDYISFPANRRGSFFIDPFQTLTAIKDPKPQNIDYYSMFPNFKSPFQHVDLPTYQCLESVAISEDIVLRFNIKNLVVLHNHLKKSSRTSWDGSRISLPDVVQEKKGDIKSWAFANNFLEVSLSKIVVDDYLRQISGGKVFLRSQSHKLVCKKNLREMMKMFQKNKDFQTLSGLLCKKDQIDLNSFTFEEEELVLPTHLKDYLEPSMTYELRIKGCIALGQIRIVFRSCHLDFRKFAKRLKECPFGKDIIIATEFW